MKIIYFFLVILSSQLIQAKRYLKPCEPCRALTKSCEWDGGAQHWYQTPYNGSINSAQSAFLSNVGYPNWDQGRIIP